MSAGFFRQLRNQWSCPPPLQRVSPPQPAALSPQRATGRAQPARRQAAPCAGLDALANDFERRIEVFEGRADSLIDVAAS